MGENLKKELHNREGLEITFVVEEGEARIEFRTQTEQQKLDDLDDIVVFVNGENIPVESHGENAATAAIGAWNDREETEQVSLMIRVGEYFEGWELET